MYAAPTLMGCLVTDKIEFEVEDNVPPVVVDKPGTDFPIGGVIWIDLDSEQNEWSFEVIVRDENVDDDLEARLRVRSRANPNPEFTPNQVVQKTGTEDRNFTVTIQRGQLMVSECRHLDLAVSGSFLPRSEPGFFDVTIPSDDIGEATWLIWEGKGQSRTTMEQADSIVQSCMTKDDLLQSEAGAAR